MKKRSCRMDAEEREQHERATRIRKMTDSQLCEYVDSLAVPAGPSREQIINDFLDTLSVRTENGLRISDATIRKMREIAQRRGLLPW